MKKKKRYIESPFTPAHTDTCLGCGRELHDSDHKQGLHFEVNKGPQGWTAHCLEMDEYFIGGPSSDPTDGEIAEALKQLMYAIMESEHN